MKRLLISLFLSAIIVIPSFAQDMESVTNLYNSAATALNEGNKTEALKLFEEALAQTELIGADAMDVADNCKKVIPTIYLAIGKEQAAARDMDNALATLNKTIEKAKEFSDNDVLTEAQDLIPQLYLAEGNSLLNDGKFVDAVNCYKKVVEINPENGLAYLRMGMASSKTADDATTISAFEKAAQLGQEAQANKQLSTFYLKKADAFRKAKNNAMSMEFAQKSYITQDNPNARKIYAMVAAALNKNTEAVESFEAYLSLSPNAKDANQIMYQLAKIYETMKNNDKACGYYKKIMSDPQFAEYATHKVKNVLKCN